MKVVQYLVKEVNQFPSDIECMRYIATIADKVCVCFYCSCSKLKFHMVYTSSLWISGNANRSLSIFFNLYSIFHMESVAFVCS